jgi:phospholipid/cholesterol/gamma-HCH transport system substrate-binding protein
MKDRSIEYKVGLLMVGAAALFAGFIFFLGNFSFRDGYTVYADYDFSGNVQAGAPVKVSGITVGRVEDVSFRGGQIDERTGRRVQVRVTLWIEDRARESIRGDAEFFINTAGVLGEQYVEIVPGRDWEGPALEEGSIVVGVNPPRTDLVVARLYELLDILTAVMHEDRDRIRTLIEHGADAVDQVDAILIENRTRVPALLDAVTELAVESKQVLAKVDRGLEPEQVASTVRHADALLVTADKAIADVSREGLRVMSLATEQRVDRVIGVVDKAGKAADQAAELLDNVDGAVRDVRAGKGTLGALVAKPELYADLREMIRDLRKNPWKLLWKE